jgi:glycosyltransferase involved in cell wall biosynthesis
VDYINQPLVSVVIPTYNHALFLERALKSVIEQTYSNWEAIVVDNHSKDNTDEVVASFLDNRIKLLKIHNHGSIAKSRNLGINNATGKWIAFLDSDDLWYKEKLALSIAAILKNPALDACSTNELLVDSSNNVSKPLHHGPFCNNFYKTLLLEGNRLSPSAVIVKKEFLDKHQILFRENVEFITAEDFDFWLLMAEKNANFYFINSIQGEYTIHQSNASGKLEFHLNNVKNVLKNHIFHRQLFTNDKKSLWNAVHSRLLISESRRYFASKRYGPAISTLFQAAFKAPLFTTSYSIKKLIKRHDLTSGN